MPSAVRVVFVFPVFGLCLATVVKLIEMSVSFDACDDARRSSPGRMSSALECTVDTHSSTSDIH